MTGDLKWLMYLTEVENRGHSFNGPSLMETVCPLTLEQVISTATHQSYTVWGIVLHCAFFKWKMIRFIDPHAAIDFRYEKTDFPRLPMERSRAAWGETLVHSDRIHEHYMRLLSSLPESFLDRAIGEWDCSAGQAIAWLAAHDTYHNAQIRNMGLEGL